MKRHLTYFLAAFLAVVSFGCTSDVEEPIGDIELTIQLTMAHEMKTRVPRPLEGVDAWQHVTDVKVYLFRAETEDGKYTIYPLGYQDKEGNPQNYINVDAFKQKGDEIYKGKDHEQHYVIVNPKLQEGYYRLFAIGVDEDTDDDSSVFKAINEASTWDTVLKTFDDPRTHEFFSGYSETVHITSSVDKNFINIELKRCVAGVLLYVKNFPPKDCDNIQLILSGYSPRTDIVNRTWTADSLEGDKVLVDFKEGLENGTVKLEEGTENCYYTGRFLIPCKTRYMANPTMRLAYLKDGGEVRTPKNVVLTNALDNNYEQDKEYDYGNQSLNVDKTGKYYNMVANHIYCIGFRSETIKDPIDLNEENDEVKIIAYGSWQADVDIEL